MIVWNHGKKPVFITTDFEADTKGGPAVRIHEICIEPGAGIDLEIIGLREARPERYKKVLIQSGTQPE